jgi:uncharacterized protein (TIGR01777 family)
MNFFILGGTGFIGVPLIRFLLKKKNKVTALARSESKAELLPPGTAILTGNPLSPGKWQDKAGKSDVIINLVGRNIATRWTEEAKQAIMETRILSTRMAAEAIPHERAHEITLINADAVGHYGDTGDAIITEEFPPGKGFLAEVTNAWENETKLAREKGAKVVFTRFGVVLGKGGGIIGQMLPVFRLGVGGRLGNGRQWFSWIHIHDLCRAMLFVLEKGITGPVNFCAPHPVTNKYLTETLARLLKRPAIFPVPGFLLRSVIGGAADMALQGQRAVPRVLEKAGFPFDFPTLEEALKDIISA